MYTFVESALQFKSVLVECSWFDSWGTLLVEIDVGRLDGTVLTLLSFVGESVFLIILFLIWFDIEMLSVNLELTIFSLQLLGNLVIESFGTFTGLEKK